MDTTLMDAIIGSSTALITSLVGAIFTYVQSIAPLLVALLALGLLGYLIRRVMSLGKKVK